MWNLIICAMVNLAALDVSVHPIAGDRFSGELSGLTAEKIVLQTSDGPREIDVREILQVTTTRSAPAAIAKNAMRVELVDGSQLLVSSYQVADRIATIQLLGGESVQTHIRQIRSVRFRSPSEKVDRQWDQILAAEAGGDVVVVRKSPDALDQVEGILGDITGEQVQFEFSGQQLPVKREKLEGILYFHPPGRTLPEPLAVISDSHGCAWQARSALLSAGGTLDIATPAGLKYSMPLDQLVKLDFSAGNLVYLSDLVPESTTWIPYFGTQVASEKLAQLYKPRPDRSFSGGPLELPRDEGGETKRQTFEKGLAIHSRSEIVYRLVEGFRHFRAVAGIDQQVRPNGNVELVISGDGRELYRGRLSGQDQAIDLDLDIQGVKRLRILVDFGDELDIADHLNLCNARIIK